MGVLEGDDRVLLGRGQWPHRGPPSPRAARTEGRDRVQRH